MSVATAPPTDRTQRGRAAQPQPETAAQPEARWLPPGLAIVLAIGLALRLLVVAWLAWHGQELYVWDERDYDKLAHNLLHHAEFSFEEGQPISLRPPLYPAMLAVTYSAFGEHNFTAVRLWQALLGTMTAWIVFALARSLFDERTGIVAAGIVAFYPSLVAASGLILTETLFTCFVCASCLMMQQCLVRGGAWRFAALGALLALGALTRSVLWLFPPVLVVFLLVCEPSRTLSRRLLHAAIAVAVFAVVIAPWAYRNTRLQQTFTVVDVMGGRNFMMGNYEHTPEDRPWDAITVQGDKSWHAILWSNGLLPPAATQGQVDKAALKYGLSYVRHHAAQTLGRDIAKFFHFWQLERELPAGLSRGYWGNWPRTSVIITSLVIVVSYVSVVLGGVYGWLLRPSPSWRMHIFLLLVVAFVCGIHTLVFAHSRYHLPLMPLLAVYAAAAWTAGRSLLADWRRPIFWLAQGVCLLLLASWLRDSLTDVPRLFSFAAAVRDLL